MVFTRRSFMASTAATLAAVVALPRSARAALAADTLKALTDSDVVYLTPLKRSGAESTCKAEIWFVEDNGAIYLVTSASAWRARAIGKGLTRARIWVGEFGTWTDAKDAFRAAPTFEADGSVVATTEDQGHVLAIMGEKYRASWLVWGPRFRNGLADGSRVMLRYTPV